MGRIVCVCVGGGVDKGGRERGREGERERQRERGNVSKTIQFTYMKNYFQGRYVFSHYRKPNLCWVQDIHGEDPKIPSKVFARYSTRQRLPGISCLGKVSLPGVLFTVLGKEALPYVYS